MFDFGCKILTPDGQPDSRYAFEGQPGMIKTGGNQDPAWDGYPVVAEATCTNAARGGCLGGTLEIAANALQWPKLEVDQLVEFYWDRHDPASKFYRGRVARCGERRGSGLTHVFNLSGAWPLLDQFEITEVFKLGFDEGASTTGTVAGCYDYIALQVVGITGTDLTKDFTSKSAAASGAAGVPVKAITIVQNEKLAGIFETLEFMARGGDDASPQGYYAIGADENGAMYLNRLDENTVLFTAQPGNDHAYRPLADWTEQIITRWPIKNLSITGGVIQSGSNAGLSASKIITDTEALSGRKVMKPRDVTARGADTTADFELFGKGWFRSFARRATIVKDMMVIVDAPPRPWLGFINFKSKNEAGDYVDQKRFWDTVDFKLSTGTLVKISLGDENEPRLSSNQGQGLVRRFIRDMAGPFDPPAVQVTREDAPDGPVVSGGGTQFDTTQVYVVGWPISGS